MSDDKKNFVLNGLDGESKAAFLERIWNTTPDQMCLAQMIYDDAGIPVNYIILDINPAYEKAFGFARDKAINRKVTEMFPYYDLAFIEKCGEAVRSGTSLISVTHIFKAYPWCEVQVFPLGSGDQFITIAKDISECKKLENALSSRTEELENKEEEREWLFSDAEKQRSHLLSIFMQLPVGVAVFDKGGKPLLKNELMDLYMPRMIPSKDPRGIRQWRALDTEVMRFRLTSGLGLGL